MLISGAGDVEHGSRRAEATRSGAVIGAGVMGRHHARILATHPRTRLAGVVELNGDRCADWVEAELVHRSIDELLDTAPPDFAVVALPTDAHPAAAAALAEAGVHMLIEKPLAADLQGAQEIIQACRAGGVLAAVGHVERHNPAMVELRRRVHGGELGELFLVASERIGPFPDRVRGVGVVKDLATHDLDILPWIAGQPIAMVAAQAYQRIGRDHEDLVVINGRLRDGTVVALQVDWLTPTKARRTRVVGEGGMLVANTLSGELSFYENGAQAEGHVVSDALSGREPLLAQMDAFCDLLEGLPGAYAVSLEEGLAAVGLAEAVLDSAARQESVTIEA
jgi:UDP-N-acetylglucosamine 3-dehydrogenase